MTNKKDNHTVNYPYNPFFFFSFDTTKWKDRLETFVWELTTQHSYSYTYLYLKEEMTQEEHDNGQA